MIWTILISLAAAVVAVLPGLAIGWLCARGVRGWGADGFNASVTVFVLAFVAAYVASAYALLAWWV